MPYAKRGLLCRSKQNQPLCGWFYIPLQSLSASLSIIEEQLFVRTIPIGGTMSNYDRIRQAHADRQRKLSQRFK